MQLKTNAGRVVLGLLAVIVPAQTAHASDVQLVSVDIDSLAVIQQAIGGHQAGDMEVRLTAGYDPQRLGLNCYDPFYLTTLRTDDSDKRMFELLTAARVSGRPVTMWITDDPAHTAYFGRCSVEVVEY